MSIPLSQAIRQAISQTAPLAASVFTYGLVFGALAQQAGLSTLEALMMSALVYAGSAQFLALGMLATGATALPVVISTLIVNLRHLLMGASLAPYLRGEKPWRLAVLAAGMSDESYAATISFFSRNGGNTAFFLTANLLVYSAWVLSTLFGALAGSRIPDPALWGLDFAFAGAFIGLLVPHLKGRPALAAFGSATITSILLAPVLPGNWHILIAGLIAPVAGMVVDRNGH